MRRPPVVRHAIGAVLCALLASTMPASPQDPTPSPTPTPGPPVGDFEGSTDVGGATPAGRARFDATRGEYVVTGAGHDMWDEKDAFHFVWRRLTGDLTVSAEVSFAERAGDPHRKAGWVIREGLDADAPYAGAIVHADGLISLQYRVVRGGPTLEVQSPVRAPATVRLERAGDLMTLWVARQGGPAQPVGSVLVPLRDPVHAGLGVCSHDAAAPATAVLANVGFANPGPAAEADRVLESTLEVVSIETGEREAVHTTRGHIEAPNWSRDGSTFFFNSGGKLYALPRPGGEPRLVDTGPLEKLNNDHGLSPDGQWLAVSDQTKGDSLVYVLPAAGGPPRLVTATGPSYWHGWSPDGTTLAYCAERGGEYDVYTIDAAAESSTDERRLTSARGLDDGPDYSPDGSTIFFNSDRSGGRMRIWRMDPDGSNQRPVTSDWAYADWFPHPSPDGRWLVFLSYDAEVRGHPPNKEVVLRIMPVEGGKPRVLVRLFGGQGTINVPSWSPDSKAFAFVSYRLVKP